MYKNSLEHLQNQIGRIRTINNIAGSDISDKYLAMRYMLLNKKSPLSFDKYIKEELGLDNGTDK